jgi:cbb3-type cytochrome oxidase subunit 3
MTQQNFKNHTRMVPMYHYVTGTLLLGILGGGIVNLIHADAKTHYSAALLVAIALVLISIFWYARVFALRAQDRAIRAEENFRHFILTGKPLDAKLGMGQIIALRFASDAEMPDLAVRALTQNLNAKDIKEAIQNWKPDHHRV